MTKTQYRPVIGLEVHIELATKSKMFCGCSAEHFHVPPNTHTCPVCLGLPGALPVPNQQALEWTALIGLSLGCSIPAHCKFDRKHYFYPDLPKGYQISQYDQPLAENGRLQLYNGKIVDIVRVHLEEDTGKLIHTTLKGQNVTLIDFNRGGVPLVEIVTEPCFYSSADAKLYLKTVQLIVRRLGVSSCDLEKGSMRLEANISVVKLPQAKLTDSEIAAHIKKVGLPRYKVEVKNLNSFRFVEKAINYELSRQKKILEAGQVPAQETRGFIEKEGKTIYQRSKEQAHDYRYFPEPDIPPLSWKKGEINQLKTRLNPSPTTLVHYLEKEYGLTQNHAVTLVYDDKRWVIAKQVMESSKINSLTKTGLIKRLVNLPTAQLNISLSELAKQVSSINSFAKISDKELSQLVNQIIKSNPQVVESYRRGKTQVLGFLIGMALKESGLKLNPKRLRAKFQAALATPN